MSERSCSIDGCEDPVRARGWCGRHYQRWRATGDPLTEPRKPNRIGSARLNAEEAETGLRKCVACGVRKPLDEFAEYKYGRNGRCPSCKPCRKAAMKAAHSRRKQQNPERIRRKAQSVYLRARYGIDVDEYDAKVAAQRGRCAACGRRPKLVLDHDHETGHVRGLICNPCNLALGFADDSIDRLRKLAAYLYAHKGRLF